MESTLQHIGVRLDVCSGPAVDELSRRCRRLHAQAPEQFKVDHERGLVAGFARDLLCAACVGIDECGACIVKGGDRQRQQFAVVRRRAGVAVGGQVVVLRGEGQEPVDFLYQLDNCLLGQRRAGRSKWRRQVGRAKLGDCGLRGSRIFVGGRTIEGGAQVIGQPMQCVAGQRAEPGLRWIAPHEEDGQRSDDRCECPSLQPRADRTRVRGQRERKDQHEHRGRRPLGDVAAQDSEEQHERGRDCCDDDGEPGDSRGQGADGDEEGTDDGESGIGDEATAKWATEVGEQQHREGADGGERRDLRVLENLVSEGEQAGNDDGGADRTFRYGVPPRP